MKKHGKKGKRKNTLDEISSEDYSGKEEKGKRETRKHTKEKGKKSDT